ncbi:MAG: hypothetical protein F6K62_11575 [Sphaerospermopsis sp. SIO1G2]|nr:hypothetical protein [Sphaerospermopsis sp. SIO1G1]NET71537.1 hypothetical protein [Sphaerospermopsis sp. SIO1G2]
MFQPASSSELPIQEDSQIDLTATWPQNTSELFRFTFCYHLKLKQSMTKNSNNKLATLPNW